MLGGKAAQAANRAVAVVMEACSRSRTNGAAAAAIALKGRMKALDRDESGRGCGRIPSGKRAIKGTSDSAGH